MSSKRTSISGKFADILAKANKLLKEGKSVTLIPTEGGCDIFYAYSNQLVLFAPPALGSQEASQQVFAIGDRVARGRNHDYRVQYCIKRIEAKDRVVVCPMSITGAIDWSTELLFKPVEIVLVQAFRDLLVNGLDVTTISEDWKALESAKNLRDSLQIAFAKAEAEYIVLQQQS